MHRNSVAWIEIGIQHCQGVLCVLISSKNIVLCTDNCKKARFVCGKLNQRNNQFRFNQSHNLRCWVHILCVLLWHYRLKEN